MPCGAIYALSSEKGNSSGEVTCNVGRPRSLDVLLPLDKGASGDNDYRAGGTKVKSLLPGALPQGSFVPTS